MKILNAIRGMIGLIVIGVPVLAVAAWVAALSPLFDVDGFVSTDVEVL